MISDSTHRIQIQFRPRLQNKFASNRSVKDRIFSMRHGRLIWFLLILYRQSYPAHFFVDNFTYEDEVYHMARTKSEWQFANVKLTEKDKPKLIRFSGEFDDNPMNILTEIASRQYKLSVSWVDKQNSFVVSVSGTENSKINNGVTMTSWSDDVEEAIFMTGYKVLEVTQDGVWLEYAEESSNWG